MGTIEVTNYNFEEESHDKSYESAVWKGLLALLTLVFILGVYNCGKEVFYYTTGETMVGDLRHDTNYTVSVMDGQGHNTQISVSRIYNKVVDNKVDLYYINDDVTTALPMTKPWIWGIDFTVMGLLYTLFIYKIYKIYRKPKYMK